MMDDPPTDYVRRRKFGLGSVISARSMAWRLGSFVLGTGVLVTALPARSATFCARPSAQGAATGEDWTNAVGLSSAVSTTSYRGHTIYISGESYGSLTFSAPSNGTSTIAIVKATPSDHVTDAGWEPEWGTSAATFSQIEFDGDHFVLDGQIGRWGSGLIGFEPYGIQVVAENVHENQRLISTQSGSTGNIVRHVEAYYSTPPRSGTWYKGGHIISKYGGSYEFHHCWFHDAENGIYNGYLTSVLFDHCVLERNGHGQVAMRWDRSEHSEIAAVKNGVATFRYSHIRDWRSTGGLIAFDVNAPQLVVHGNVFSQSGYWAVPGEASDSNGVINGLGKSNDIVVEVFNNTFANLTYGAELNSRGSYARREIKNNIFYDVTRHFSDGAVLGGPHSYNWFFGAGTQSETGIQHGDADPLVNASAGDFHLLANTDPGETLDNGYATDMDGVSRSTWSRGAFEWVEMDETCAQAGGVCCCEAPEDCESCPLDCGLCSDDFTTPVIEELTATCSGDFTLTWSLPTSEAGVPQGGFDTWIDGVDSNDSYRTHDNTTVVNGLRTDVVHCFQVQARWLQANPEVLTVSTLTCMRAPSCASCPDDSCDHSDGNSVIRSSCSAGGTGSRLALALLILAGLCQRRRRIRVSDS